MKYLSIDLETTGLNPKQHQILEFAAVLDDTEKMIPLEKLLSFNCLVGPGVSGNYCGDPFALQMNHEILRMIATAEKGNILPIVQPETLGIKFQTWLSENGIGDKIFPGLNAKPTSIICAGKNFASFDRPFLENTENFSNHVKFKHRVLDPCLSFVQPSDTEPPNTEKCCARSGMLDRYYNTPHRALYDAMLVIQLTRYVINNFEWIGLPDDWSKD